MTWQEELYRVELRNAPALLASGGPSFLESKAVGTATKADYERKLAAFLLHADLDLLQSSLLEIETGLLEFFDQCFLEGRDVGYGLKVLQAVAFHRPELRSLKASGLLPRARLALQGWGRVAPVGTRDPLPWPVLAGLVVLLLLHGHADMALASLVAADAYLRPVEALSLRGEDVVPGQAGLGRQYKAPSLLLFPHARGQSSKTGQFDDSIVLDTRGRGYVYQTLLSLAKRRLGRPVFSFTQAKWLKAFKEAAKSLGIESWDVVLHLLRHTGPSDDYLAKRRSLADIQRRGRWAAVSSVRRYEKASKIGAMLKRLKPRQMAFCQDASKYLEEYLTGLRPLPVACRLAASSA